MTELDLVVLKESILEHGLVTGDVGTMVHRYDAVRRAFQDKSENAESAGLTGS